ALSAASFSVARATAGSFVTLWGSGFTDQTAFTPGLPLPLALADVTVTVTDASGASAQAGLHYVSPYQINLLLPSTLAAGRAQISVMRNGTLVASGEIQVANTAPAMFTVNSAGFGLAAALLQRVKADGSQTYEPVVQYDSAQNV